MAAGKLFSTGGFAALAAGLALIAMPVTASAQERGNWRGGGDNAAGAQRGGGGGNWGGGNRGGGDGGRSASSGTQLRVNGPGSRQSQPQQQPSIRQSNGGGQPEVRGNWRGGQDRSAAGVNRQSQIERQWNNQGNTANRTNERADARQREIERQWSGQAPSPGWQNGDRNRTYADPNRDRTYRGDNDRRDNDRSRNDNARRDNERWRNDNNRWSNNGNNRWNNNNNNNNNRWSGNDSRRWDRQWRGNNRYDWQGYRNSNRNAYRLGSYYAPYRGYSYRRVGIGFSLDSLFFGSRYWINDPWQYRLPDAYGPYRWVRYYDDVLLVDTYTGQVVDVINDFFW